MNTTTAKPPTVITAPRAERSQPGQRGNQDSSLREKPSISISRKTAITSGVRITSKYFRVKMPVTTAMNTAALRREAAEARGWAGARMGAGLETMGAASGRGRIVCAV